jgi:uncharacterized membrane-anchored protein YhcB (DUF1043 family)
MDAETPKTIETLRLSLIAVVTSLKAQQQQLYHLNATVKSLSETLHKSDPGSYAEVQQHLAAGVSLDLNILEQQSLDAILEILRAIPEAD